MGQKDQNEWAETHSNASSSSPRTTIRRKEEDSAKYSSQITSNNELIRLVKKYQLYGVASDYPRQNMSARSEHSGFICFYELPFRLGLCFHIPQVIWSFLSYFDLAPNQLMQNCWWTIKNYQSTSPWPPFYFSTKYKKIPQKNGNGNLTHNSERNY